MSKLSIISVRAHSFINMEITFLDLIVNIQLSTW